MDYERLDRALNDRFGGTAPEREVLCREVRDLVDSGIAADDRGHELTVDEILTHLADAPDGTDLVEKWNWWMGALDIAYGGYERFTIRFVSEENDVYR